MLPGLGWGFVNSNLVSLLCSYYTEKGGKKGKPPCLLLCSSSGHCCFNFIWAILRSSVSHWPYRHLQPGVTRHFQNKSFFFSTLWPNSDIQNITELQVSLCKTQEQTAVDEDKQANLLIFRTRHQKGLDLRWQQKNVTHLGFLLGLAGFSVKPLSGLV